MVKRNLHNTVKTYLEKSSSTRIKELEKELREEKEKEEKEKEEKEKEEKEKEEKEKEEKEREEKQREEKEREEKERKEMEEKEKEREEKEKEEKEREEKEREEKHVSFNPNIDNEIEHSSDFMKKVENDYINENIINKKKEAINLIINYIKICNKRGIFDLIESRDIYTSIINTTKLAATPNELQIQANSAAHLMKALSVAQKRGCFEIEESYEIANACELFTS